MPEPNPLALSEVDRPNVSNLHHKSQDTPFQANQTLDVLAKMFWSTEAWGMTLPRRNPCSSVRFCRKNRRERLLTLEEYRTLGRASDEAETEGGFLPSGVAAIRLLMTGCCKNEIVTLSWDDINRTAGKIRLRAAETAVGRIPLIPAGFWRRSSAWTATRS